jgi:hypothetical protein
VQFSKNKRQPGRPEDFDPEPFLPAKSFYKWLVAFFAWGEKMVGVTGVEPVTLRLSSACSNQLSYTPIKPNGLPSRSSPARELPACPQKQASARQPSLSAPLRAKAGGAEEIRTPDL